MRADDCHNMVVKMYPRFNFQRRFFNNLNTFQHLGIAND